MKLLNPIISFALSLQCIRGWTASSLSHTRRQFLNQGSILTLASSMNDGYDVDAVSTVKSMMDVPKNTVAYRSTFIPMTNEVQVPMAVWYPISPSSTDSTPKDLILDVPDIVESTSFLQVREEVQYKHRISVSKIGQLLAGWNFIPEFLSRDFDLSPTNGNFVVGGEDVSLPKEGPVILLAHGYLGSRFDLSHLAESLAMEGFTCISPEYPESLAASYPNTPQIDRNSITQKALQRLKELRNNPEEDTTKYGVIGHSLGCGTATMTGDKSWVRVCIAGPPAEREDTVGGSMLFIASVNDGAVTLDRLRGSVPSDFSRLSTDDLDSAIPRRTAFIFDSPEAPNHISFLTDGVNNCMIDLLSPLLPVAQTLGIPVLDFDKYKESRDSEKTAEVYVPLITRYLKQRMMV